MNEVKRCRRCLLQDMTNENDYFASVLRYRQTLVKKLRTDDALYESRLNICKHCTQLENGTCLQCGCYVEMRAARIDMHCPMPKQW